MVQAMRVEQQPKVETRGKYDAGPGHDSVSARPRSRVFRVAREICNLVLHPLASVEPLELFQIIFAHRTIRHFQKIQRGEHAGQVRHNLWSYNFVERRSPPE